MHLLEAHSQLPSALHYSKSSIPRSITMGVDRTVLNPGNGTMKPKKGDVVRVEYTGYLYDESKDSNQGKQYVLSAA